MTSFAHLFDREEDDEAGPVPAPLSSFQRFYAPSEEPYAAALPPGSLWSSPAGVIEVVGVGLPSTDALGFYAVMVAYTTPGCKGLRFRPCSEFLDGRFSRIG